LYKSLLFDCFFSLFIQVFTQNLSTKAIFKSFYLI